MADKKISQLSSATTPLGGTEILPIVQGGSTVSVSAANVTAGRAISASSVAVTGASAPANGVYLPAANSVGISTNSANAVYINSSGNVSIAEGNAPTQALNVYRSGSTAAYLAAGNSNTGLNGTYFGVDTTGKAIINQTAALNLDLQTSGVTRIGIASAGNVTISTGDLIMGTAGKGVDFSANTHATGMTKEKLDWYEEGAYTPTVASGSGTITSYTATAWYTRIGRSVTLIANVTITDAGTGAGVCTITLPFTNNATVVANGVGRENAISGDLLQGSISVSGTVVNVLKYTNATAIATGAQIRITITYFV